MADNFIDCTTNSFGMPTLLASLFAEVMNIALLGTGQYAFRVVTKTAGDSGVIVCNTKDDFVELFHQALEMADDNKPALRVVITDRANGVSLKDVPDCTDYESIGLFARNTFIYDSDGNVAFNLANIT